MRLSMSLCQQTRMLDIPTGRPKIDIVTPWWQKPKVMILMGSTGTGKSRLSLDLATQFPAEIINSDKMQVYKGLEITTNKITEEESSGIPHHVLGVVNPNADFTSRDFCNMASSAIDSISTRGLLPIIVGGSNSYIESLIDDAQYKFRSRYECCFLWLDVSMAVLKEYLSNRVDEMLRKGMVDEVRSIFDPNADYNRGIRKSIGVPELDKYLRSEFFMDEEDSTTRSRLLQEAILEIKDNSYKLARKQSEKIRRLKNEKGWNIHRIDATEVLRNKEDDEIWKKIVRRPSISIVRQFLYSNTVAEGTKDFCFFNKGLEFH